MFLRYLKIANNSASYQNDICPWKCHLLILLTMEKWVMTFQFPNGLSMDIQKGWPPSVKEGSFSFIRTRKGHCLVWTLKATGSWSNVVYCDTRERTGEGKGQNDNFTHEPEQDWLTVTLFTLFSEILFIFYQLYQFTLNIFSPTLRYTQYYVNSKLINLIEDEKYLEKIKNNSV